MKKQNAKKAKANNFTAYYWKPRKLAKIRPNYCVNAVAGDSYKVTLALFSGDDGGEEVSRHAIHSQLSIGQAEELRDELTRMIRACRYHKKHKAWD